jgi:hypothetical protein
VERLRAFAQPLRFGLVGVLSVESLGLGKLAATGVAFVFGFWLNRRWTFASRHAT